MKGIIDRFEGNLVVVEIDGETIDFDKSIFPKESSVGDVVEIINNQVTISKEETKKLHLEIKDLMDEVFDD